MTNAKHRAARPRYGRLAAVVASVSVVAVALVTGTGLVRPEQPPLMDAATRAHGRELYAPLRQSLAVDASRPVVSPPPASAPAPVPTSAPTAARTSAPARARKPRPRRLPADSGSGRRIVFDQSAQRVWLVDAEGHVERTYLGSGSVLDNLHPGTYAVYSRSRWAVGVDDSGVMEYFVRFTRGPAGAAIGFHTIPTKDGIPLQRTSQLGTPQSHGCIRQRAEDAIALWDFAPVGTPVVVVA